MIKDLIFMALIDAARDLTAKDSSSMYVKVRRVRHTLLEVIEHIDGYLEIEEERRIELITGEKL